MTMVSTGPISIGGSATSGGLNQSINIELGRAATATSSLNETAFRNLAGVPSGAISLSNFYGKANAFAFSISANTNNLNLRTAAVNAGWNQSTQVIATINGDVTIGSASTGTAAMIVNGAFPGGVSLINNGTIVGMGGAGGAGRTITQNSIVAPIISGGSAGDSGGTALSVSVPISITNNGTVAGGGGGGGRSSLTNSAGGALGPAVSGVGTNGNAGSAGTFAGGGAGGPQVTRTSSAGTIVCRVGGAGGGWGSTGATGGEGTIPGQGSGVLVGSVGLGGGGAGPATSGNSSITWVVTGTRLGPLN